MKCVRVPFILAVLGWGVVGCVAYPDMSEDPEPKPQNTQLLSSRQICAGLFSGKGGKALEALLESAKLRPGEKGENPDVRAVAQAMENAYRAGRGIDDAPQSICSVRGAAGSRYPNMRVIFTADSKNSPFPSDLQGVGASEVRVSFPAMEVSLAYDCVSPRVGSTQDIPLTVHLRYRGQPDQGDEATLREKFGLTITHSAALAVAKELGCVSDGWLPAAAEGLPEPGGAAGVPSEGPGS